MKGSRGLTKRLALKLHRGLNRVGADFEQVLPSRRGSLEHRPPVFVLGPPRAGTTLLYQVICYGLKVGYISNIHCLGYGAPSLVHRIVAPCLDLNAGVGFESSFGSTSGLSAPSECGVFWYRFFPRDPQEAVQRKPLSEASKRELVAAVGRLTNAFGRRLVFKNVMNVLRIDELATAFPASQFLIINRDIYANAHSLLWARREVEGSYDAWYSTPVPGYQRLKEKPPHEQVVCQVRKIRRLIDQATDGFGEERIIRLQYEDLCRDVPGTLSALVRFLSGEGLRRLDIDIPASFRCSHPRERKREDRIDESLDARLRAYLSDVTNGTKN